MKAKLEYVWLDGYHPSQSLRSKTQVRDDFGGTLEECPMWSFDGNPPLTWFHVAPRSVVLCMPLPGPPLIRTHTCRRRW